MKTILLVGQGNDLALLLGLVLEVVWVDLHCHVLLHFRLSSHRQLHTRVLHAANMRFYACKGLSAHRFWQGKLWTLCLKKKFNKKAKESCMLAWKASIFSSFFLYLNRTKPPRRCGLLCFLYFYSPAKNSAGKFNYSLYLVHIIVG